MFNKFYFIIDKKRLKIIFWYYKNLVRISSIFWTYKFVKKWFDRMVVIGDRCHYHEIGRILTDSTFFTDCDKTDLSTTIIQQFLTFNTNLLR